MVFQEFVLSVITMSCWLLSMYISIKGGCIVIVGMKVCIVYSTHGWMDISNALWTIWSFLRLACVVGIWMTLLKLRDHIESNDSVNIGMRWMYSTLRRTKNIIIHLMEAFNRYVYYHIV